MKTVNTAAHNSKPERNAEIVRLYEAGEPIGSICEKFGIKQQRVYQILHKAGIKPVRTKPAGRDRFLGVNLPGPVKDALKAEADRRGISMSALSSDSLKEMLISCGYPLEAESIP